MSRRPAQHAAIRCRTPFASYMATIGECSADFRTTRADTETLGFGSRQRSIERSDVTASDSPRESCWDLRRSSKRELIGCTLRLSHELGRCDGGFAR